MLCMRLLAIVAVGLILADIPARLTACLFRRLARWLL